MGNLVVIGIKIKRPADLSIVKRLGRFYWVQRYNIICTPANERYEKYENNAKIAPLKEHLHTIYLKNTNIVYGAYFPAIEQLYSASAFVEIVPKRNCIAVMQYLTVAFP
ncbi:MAG: hypothetical protein IKY67_01905 [Paludibacteraceae bacterium]|nr:hypothetical protein [Paludibacteraceae bacterium]